MSQAQIFPIALSPYQRLNIQKLLDPDIKFLQGLEEAMRYKRCLDALAIPAIEEVATANGGKINLQYGLCREAVVFTLTLENADFFKDVLLTRLPLSSSALAAVLPIVKQIEDIKSGAARTESKAPQFDPVADRAAWVPVTT
jgi:hypothetical protein